MNYLLSFNPSSPTLTRGSVYLTLEFQFTSPPTHTHTHTRTHTPLHTHKHAYSRNLWIHTVLIWMNSRLPCRHWQSMNTTPWSSDSCFWNVSTVWTVLGWASPPTSSLLSRGCQDMSYCWRYEKGWYFPRGRWRLITTLTASGRMLPQAVCCLRLYAASGRMLPQAVAVYVSLVLRLVITGIGFPLVWFLKQQQSTQVKQCFRYKKAKTTYSRGSGGYIIVISHNWH